MSTKSTIHEFDAIPLGSMGVVAPWRRPIEAESRFPPSVIIMPCSTTEEGVFTPASDVLVFGAYALKALRAAINMALREDDKGQGK